jgi:hypothetical protein
MQEKLAPVRLRTASQPALEPFVRQWAVLLTTYKRDGTPVGTPVNIAVDRDRAFVRTFDRLLPPRGAARLRVPRSALTQGCWRARSLRTPDDCSPLSIRYCTASWSGSSTACGVTRRCI